jgi:hypothetical protein
MKTDTFEELWRDARPNTLTEATSLRRRQLLLVMFTVFPSSRLNSGYMYNVKACWQWKTSPFASIWARVGAKVEEQ